jgi:hypothetical protein
LLWSLKREVGDVDGIEEIHRPGLRLRRLKHNSVAVPPDEHRRRQVNALGQADGLAVASNGNMAVSMRVKLFHEPEETKPGNQFTRVTIASRHCARRT